MTVQTLQRTSTSRNPTPQPSTAADPITAALEAAAERGAERAFERFAESLSEHTLESGLKTRAGLAKRLGISLATLNRLRQQGMPCVMLLDSPRYDYDEVLAWLKSRGSR